jgi:hypothetical protein
MDIQQLAPATIPRHASSGKFDELRGGDMLDQEVGVLDRGDIRGRRHRRDSLGVAVSDARVRQEPARTMTVEPAAR